MHGIKRIFMYTKHIEAQKKGMTSWRRHFEAIFFITVLSFYFDFTAIMKIIISQQWGRWWLGLKAVLACTSPVNTSSPSHIWVTRSQCVKHINPRSYESKALWFQTLVNSLKPSDAYMRQWTRPSLVQIMVRRLFGVKSLSGPVIDYC